jgi:excisionase family DNA binding protein
VSDAAARHHRLLLRPEEAAQALSISRTTLYGLLQSNAIRSVKVGGLRRIPVEALEDFVTELSSDTGADTGARCIEGTGVAGTATRRGRPAPKGGRAGPHAHSHGSDKQPCPRSIPEGLDGQADMGRNEMTT